MGTTTDAGIRAEDIKEAEKDRAEQKGTSEEQKGTGETTTSGNKRNTSPPATPEPTRAATDDK